MGIFNSLFKPKPKLADEDFRNPVTTDLHCHLIPGIDDGVQTMDESLSVLQSLAGMGYTKVITTPHIMADFYKNGPDNILPKLEEVRQAIRLNNINITLDAAAEYLVDDGFEEKITKRELLTFGDNYVLIELPFGEEPPNFKTALFTLRLNDYKPVLAHPERYAFMGSNREKYRELFEGGVLFQVNLFSALGYYSPEVQKNVEWLIDNKMVNMVGSDTHGMRHIPVFEEALRSQYYQKLCSLNLLNNTL